MISADPSLARPDEAMGYLLSGGISAGLAGFFTHQRDGLRQALLVGSVVFFGIASVKMFIDIWRRP